MTAFGQRREVIGPQPSRILDGHKMFCQNSNKLQFKPFLDFFFFKSPRLSVLLSLPTCSKSLGIHAWALKERGLQWKFKVLLPLKSLWEMKVKHKPDCGDLITYRRTVFPKASIKKGRENWWIVEAARGNLFNLTVVPGDFLNYFGGMSALLKPPPSWWLIEGEQCFIAIIPWLLYRNYPCSSFSKRIV